MATRRLILAAIVAAGLAATSGMASAAPSNELRIGYQKNGILVVARQQEAIEKRLAPLGVTVRWVEFQFGPPLLEALGIGAIDFGTTGNSPPIFAQAARQNLLYVAALPNAGSAHAILVPKDSTLQTLADLKGRKVAFAKASSAHNLTVAAIEKAGLSWSDITPVALPPSDAAAAFARGSVDAWTIWDPYYAIAEKSEGVRALALGTDIIPQNSFFLANRSYVEQNPAALRAVLDELTQVANWSRDHRGEVARLLAEGTGVEYEATKRSVDRTDFAVTAVTEDIIASQQQIADRFLKLGLIPAPVDVRAIVWHAPAGS